VLQHLMLDILIFFCHFLEELATYKRTENMIASVLLV
jgi:hypothetical protein